MNHRQRPVATKHFQFVGLRERSSCSPSPALPPGPVAIRLTIPLAPQDCEEVEPPPESHIEFAVVGIAVLTAVMLLMLFWLFH